MIVSKPTNATGGYPPKPNPSSSDPIEPNATVINEVWSYEATVKEIEATIARIESGELDLADVFDQFATAVQQLKQCEKFLADRQKQMDLLIETVSEDPEDF